MCQSFIRKTFQACLLKVLQRETKHIIKLLSFEKAIVGRKTQTEHRFQTLNAVLF
jgi:hypothetical protein